MPGAAVGELVYVPGGILAGLISDYTNGRATTCCVMLILAAPMVCITLYVPACGRWTVGTWALMHTPVCVCVHPCAQLRGKETQTESFRKGLALVEKGRPAGKLLAQGKNRSLRLGLREDFLGKGKQCSHILDLPCLGHLKTDRSGEEKEKE